MKNMKKEKKIKAAILDILDTYNNIIGAVPIQMLHYHCIHHPTYGSNCTIQEVTIQLNKLRLEGLVDVTKAYTKREK